MKKSVFAVAATMCVAASAHAADIYAPAAGGGYKDEFVPQTWAGFYTGLNGGYVFQNGNNIAYTSSTGARSSGNVGPEGGFGGTYGGYNWQAGHFVYGLEADFQGGEISGGNWNGGYTLKSDLDWWGTIRGRVGFDFGRFLVYATGGYAYGQVENQLKVGFYGNNQTSQLDGYVVGGGFEYAVTPKWSFKAEYQYIDLGPSTVNTPLSPTTAASAKVDNAYNVANFGLAYHIGGSVPLLESLK